MQVKNPTCKAAFYNEIKSIKTERWKREVSQRREIDSFAHFHPLPNNVGDVVVALADFLHLNLSNMPKYEEKLIFVRKAAKERNVFLFQ